MARDRGKKRSPGMRAIRMQIRNPVALRYGLRELINAHYRIAERTSFMKQFLQLYYICFTLKAQQQLPQEAD